MPRLAVIGGSGVYRLDLLSGAREVSQETPYGPVRLMVGSVDGQEVAFLARHGPGHAVPPHRVNYRAHIWALARLGVRRVVATSAVGSLRPRIEPGHLVLVDQFIDFTRGRPATFFDGGPGGVAHVDVTEPYCPALRAMAARAARAAGWVVHEGGVYVCTEGPRFETPAEIRAFSSLGGDVVGMTGVPEVVLAREAGMCYASLCIVTNYAAGMAGRALGAEEVFALMDAKRELLARTLALLLPEAAQDATACRCAELGVPSFQRVLAGEG